MKPVSANRKGERGYALLLVFLMAAVIALMLYQQLPRVAFESERAKALIVGEERQQPVGPFDDFVDPPWSLLFSQISCGFR